jgi:hypothetical protein
MPMVNGKKFPYTKEGMKAAKKAAKKNAVIKGVTPKQMKDKAAKIKKMAPGMKKSIGKYGKIGRM